MHKITILIYFININKKKRRLKGFKHKANFKEIEGFPRKKVSKYLQNRM